MDVETNARNIRHLRRIIFTDTLLILILVFIILSLFIFPSFWGAKMLRSNINSIEGKYQDPSSQKQNVIARLWQEESKKLPFQITANQKPNLPFYDNVMTVIRPLQYSGLSGLFRPDVTLDIDFDTKTWYLRNLHRYTDDGRVILDEGRYGLCGELAAYTYAKLKFLFEKDYMVRFVRVAESGFFLTPQSTHIVLIFAHKNEANPVTYMIDPSLGRYGKMDDFDEYIYFETSEVLHYVIERQRDVYFGINRGTPLFISKDFLGALFVEDVNGKFDKQNFAIALTATRRFKFSSRYIYAIRRVDGQTEEVENKLLAANILDNNEYHILKEKLKEWFAKVPQ